MIDIFDFIEAAKSHDLLSTLQPRHMEKLLGLAKEVRFARDKVILHEGVKADFLYFILEGKVALEIPEPGGYLTVQTLEAGDATGWFSLLDGMEGGCFQARSVQPMRALAFEGPQLRAACQSDPEFGFSMTKLGLRLAAECLEAACGRLREQAGS